MLASSIEGSVGDPVIVLLHGWPLDRRIWSELTSRLAGSGFRVVCPDLPGFGESPPLPPERWTVEGFADEISAFLHATGGDRFAVAGHSFGGYVALALAERDRLVSLGLVASRAVADSDAARAGRFATIDKVRARGAQALLPDLAAKLVAPNAPDELRARARRTIEACPPEAIVAGLSAMAARPDRTTLLESFPGPLLLIHGDADQIIPVAEAIEPARRAALLDRVILAGVGHMPMWEAPDKTADALRAWAQSAYDL